MADELDFATYRRIVPVIGYEPGRGDYFFGLHGETYDGIEVSFQLKPHLHAPGVEMLRLTALPAYSAKELIRAIVDEAWRANIRPTPHVADSDARMKHLEDMRRIAFKKLGIEP